MPFSESFTFSNHLHDRRADRRVDQAYLDRCWRDPASKVLVVGGENVATEDGLLRWLEPAAAPEGERIYLGEYEGVTYLGVMVDEVADDLGPMPLRTAAGAFTDADAGLVVHAMGLSNWHRTHLHCARCGAPTVVQQAGHTRGCPECGASHFPRTDPAVIMLITDPDHRALLGRHPKWPEGRYSTLAGFVEPGESLEDAVRREVREETGIRVGRVRYAGSQPWPFPSSLMLGFFGHAESVDVAVDGLEIEHARWFTRAEVSEMTAAGRVALPGSLSISRWLLDRWHGGPLTTEWR